jgi:hypothetical protein
MYQLLRSVSRMDLLARQAPALSSSFIVASAFYRFGSFALECLAFLGTWFVIDAVLGLALRPFLRTASRAAAE